MSRSDRFLGLPGSWKFPGWSAVWRNMWNTRRDAPLFPVKAWGFGWSFNFAYPRIQSKPLWKRVFAFLLGLVLLLAILYVLVVLVMLVLLFFSPKQEVITITLE